MPYRLITPPSKRPPKTRSKKSRGLGFILLAIVFFGVLVVGTMSYLQPLPALTPQVENLSLRALSQSLPALNWPAYGQAAIGSPGYGVLATSGQSAPAPTASTAKAITALCVLSKKPLKPGQPGPSIKLTDADVAIFNNYYSQDGSVVPVIAGETITERQALEALMLPSADNIADTLASWAFGSLQSYISYANNYVRSLGLKQTTIADASGFSAQTVSTAKDLTIVALEVIKNPALAGVVNEQQAELPVAGTVFNLNWLLGQEGIMGIKTGNTGAAGGCFLIAAVRNIDGQNITLVGAVMGAPTLNTAIVGARNLIRSADNAFGAQKIIVAGQSLGRYQSSWGARSEAVAASGLSMVLWKNVQPHAAIKLSQVEAPIAKGQRIGVLEITAGGQTKTIPVLMAHTIAEPSVSWRIFH